MLYPKSKVPTIFIIGAAEDIGSATLAELKKAYPGYCYSALVHSEEDIPKMQAMGVSVVLGSTEDLPLVAETAACHDITVNAANAADPNLAKAVLEGAKIRAAPGARARPIYLHTSATRTTTNAPTSEPTDSDHEVLDAGESGQIATYVITHASPAGGKSSHTTDIAELHVLALGHALKQRGSPAPPVDRSSNYFVGSDGPASKHAREILGWSPKSWSA